MKRQVRLLDQRGAVVKESNLPDEVMKQPFVVLFNGKVYAFSSKLSMNGEAVYLEVEVFDLSAVEKSEKLSSQDLNQPSAMSYEEMDMRNWYG